MLSKLRTVGQRAYARMHDLADVLGRSKPDLTNGLHNDLERPAEPCCQIRIKLLVEPEGHAAPSGGCDA